MIRSFSKVRMNSCKMRLGPTESRMNLDGMTPLPQADDDRPAADAGSTDDLLPTRRSLLGRLRNWEDQVSWQAFFDTYWRLIYGVARKAGLTDHEAEEVVQVYLADLAASVPVPMHSLVAFQRVRLAPGASQTLSFTLTPESMMLVDDTGASRLEPGEFRVTVGGGSPGPRGQTLGAPAPASAVFTVV